MGRRSLGHSEDTSPGEALRVGLFAASFPRQGAGVVLPLRLRCPVAHPHICVRTMIMFSMYMRDDDGGCLTMFPPSSPLLFALFRAWFVGVARLRWYGPDVSAVLPWPPMGCHLYSNEQNGALMGGAAWL